MLLFKKPFWEGLIDGSITLTFRRWQKPHVRAGGRYRCHPIGVLEVEDIRQVPVEAITAADAQAAGFASRRELLEYLAELGPLEDSTLVYRVQLHHGGDGDRVEVALDDTLSADDLAQLQAQLGRLDKNGAWTRTTLQLIEQHPRTAASKLAAMLGRETLPFKADVRKLKKLGLTQSFEVGYEISPRGRAFMSRVPAVARSTKRPARAAKKTPTATSPRSANKANKPKTRATPARSATRRNQALASSTASSSPGSTSKRSTKTASGAKTPRARRG